MNSIIHLGELEIDVVQKNIKNVHLSVLPPNGRVRIAAPIRLSKQILRSYAMSRLSWIKKQQAIMLEQSRETEREYLFLETHYVWGQPYLLEIEHENSKAGVSLEHDTVIIRSTGTCSVARYKALMNQFYRKQVREKSAPLWDTWSRRLGVFPRKLLVQKMKTKWGSCNSGLGNIRLNSELAKKPKECLEYILVHELTHLLVPNHDERFQAIMSSVLPSWRERRRLLNSEPLSHEDWSY